MSFSSDIKEELSRLKTYSNKESLKAELTGYLISNAEIMDIIAIFSSENIANIKRLYKVIRTIYEIFDANFELQSKDRNNLYILPIRKNTFDNLEYLNIDYKINLDESIIASISKKQELVASIFRGAFMGSRKYL